MLKVLLLAGLCLGWTWAQDCIDVYRAEWDARPPKYEEPMGERMYYFIHHTDTEECITQDECADIAQRVQDKHIDDQGWPDIKCHFLVGGDGQVYEGRGWDLRGDHGGNTWDGNAIGIAVIGNYTEIIPSNTVLNTLSALIDCGVDNGYLRSDYGLHGHRDAACGVSCPGDKMMEEISTWPNYKGCLTGGCQEC